MPNTHAWREKDHRFIHDADCWFWEKEVCTCGLLHHLMPADSPPYWFRRELAAHDRQIERIPKPLGHLEATKEELATRYHGFPNDFQNLGPKT